MCNGLCAILFNLIVDDDVTSILAIDGHVDDSAYMVAIVPLSTYRIHHLGVTHAYYLTAHTGTDAMTGYLFYFCYLATIGGFIREGIAESCANRMRTIMLYMSGHV